VTKQEGRRRLLDRIDPLRWGTNAQANFKRCCGDKTGWLEMWQELCEFFHKLSLSTPG
jgi:hypothetical protein